MAEEKKVHFIWEKQIIQALWRRSMKILISS